MWSCFSFWRLISVAKGSWESLFNLCTKGEYIRQGTYLRGNGKCSSGPWCQLCHCGCASAIIWVTQRRPGLLCTAKGLSFKIDQPEVLTLVLPSFHTHCGRLRITPSSILQPGLGWKGLWSIITPNRNTLSMDLRVNVLMYLLNGIENSPGNFLRVISISPPPIVLQIIDFFF